MEVYLDNTYNRMMIMMKMTMMLMMITMMIMIMMMIIAVTQKSNPYLTELF